MTVRELLNIEFSMYGRVYKHKPSNSTSLLYWLGKMSMNCKEQIDYIRTHEYKWYKEGRITKKVYQKAKTDRLPACTPSAVFGEKRFIGYELERTGIIVLDIDDITDINKCKQDVMKLPYVFFSTLSVSGDGVFCGVYYNKDNDIESTFRALQKDFKEIGYYLDQSCKDITRARYISYDDNILIKPLDKEIEMYDKKIVFEKKTDYEHSVDKELTKDDLRLLTYTIFYLVGRLGYGKKKLPYSDESSEYNYDCWMKDGYRLSNIGRDDIGLKLYQYISENSDGYEGSVDVEDNFYKFQSYSEQYTNIGYYFWLAHELLGDNWKDIVQIKG